MQQESKALAIMNFHQLSFLLLLLSLAFSAVYSQTAISGDIHDYRFDSTESPFFVEKDIIVPSGTRCIIGAGCVFLFRPFTGLTVEGTLIVEGTGETGVVFTSANDTVCNKNAVQAPGPFDWNGITVMAESNGTSISNSRISYSVYGIKSQTPNLTVARCTFSQNGQFHFTVKDKIFEVKENIPFSYPAVAAPNTEIAAIQKPVPTSPAPANNNKPTMLLPPEKLQPHATRLKAIIRFGSLGIGAAGIISGTMLTKFAFDDKTRIESMGPQAINPATGRYYERTDEAVVNANVSFTRMKTGSVIGFVIGGLGLAGCAVTFFF